jgi:hypothetical protein
MAVAEHAQAVLDPNKLRLPASPRVLEIKVQEYVDWTGDDALQVWVTIAEETDVGRLSGRDVGKLDAAIHDALLADGIKEFPYIRIAKPSELAALASGELDEDSEEQDTGSSPGE